MFQEELELSNQLPNLSAEEIREMEPGLVRKTVFILVFPMICEFIYRRMEPPKDRFSPAERSGEAITDLWTGGSEVTLFRGFRKLINKEMAALMPAGIVYRAPYRVSATDGVTLIAYIQEHVEAYLRSVGLLGPSDGGDDNA